MGNDNKNWSRKCKDKGTCKNKPNTTVGSKRKNVKGPKSSSGSSSTSKKSSFSSSSSSGGRNGMQVHSVGGVPTISKYRPTVDLNEYN